MFVMLFQFCCQCYGVIVWVGIDCLLIGVSVQDVEEFIVFDEGLLLVDWVGEFNQCGIEVVCDIECDVVCVVLCQYGEINGVYY